MSVTDPGGRTAGDALPATVHVAYAAADAKVIVVWGVSGLPRKENRATGAHAPYKTDNRSADLHAV